nr:hypothetical protein [uncultured Actinoplanes sp.]
MRKRDRARPLERPGAVRENGQEAAAAFVAVEELEDEDDVDEDDVADDDEEDDDAAGDDALVSAFLPSPFAAVVLAAPERESLR